MPENWTTVVGAVTTGMTNIVTTIKGEPLLLIGFALSFVAGCISLAKRLFRFGGRRGR